MYQLNHSCSFLYEVTSAPIASTVAKIIPNFWIAQTPENFGPKSCFWQDTPQSH